MIKHYVKTNPFADSRRINIMNDDFLFNYY